MSFKSLFYKVVHVIANDAPVVLGTAVNVVKVVEPLVVRFLGPDAIAAEAILNKAIDWAESAIQIEQQGAAKKQGASAIVVAELTNAEPILQAFGLPKNFIPSPAMLTAISTAIDTAVASRNSLSVLLTAAAAQGTPAPVDK